MKFDHAKVALIITSIVAGAGGCESKIAGAQAPVFSLSSPDLAGGNFDSKFVLAGFGCKGGNVVVFAECVKDRY